MLKKKSGRADQERLITALRQRGFKLTPQRLAMINLMEEIDHPSAEELYVRLSQDYPMLSRATVYNTLEVLKELGAVGEIRIKPNVTLYDRNTTLHYHLLCRRCGRVIDVDPGPESDLEWLSRNLSKERLEAYRVERIQVHLHGVCSECLGEGKEVPQENGAD